MTTTLLKRLRKRPEVDEVDRRGGAITASGDAWEYIYELLQYLVKRGTTVVINDEWLLQLSYIDDPFNYDVGAVVAGRLWDEEASGYVGPSLSIPLFHEDGETFIRTIHIN